MKSSIKLLLLGILWNSSLHALENEGIKALAPRDMTPWGTPKTLPPGAQDYVLHGNSEIKGIYTVRLKLPANYKIPSYYQSEITYITVISGSYCIGIGNQLDKTKETCIPQGGFIIIPKNIPVYAWTSEPTVIQINGEGPLKVTRVNKVH